jgi:TetR/AcrR family transcriptional regulator, tetracycline repressor protein
MGRPRALTHETVIAAALSISDSEGLPALTVRRLAEALDVTGMALYTYFKNKHDLEQAVADALLERIPPPAPDAPDRATELARFFSKLYRLCIQHPSLISIFNAGPVLGPAAYRRTDAVLSLLRASGLSRAAAVQAHRAITSWTLGFILLGSARQVDRNGNRQAQDPQTYPALDDLGPLLAKHPTRAEFEDGLERIIAAFVPAPS